MRKSLIAIATAGLLASGAAVAANTPLVRDQPLRSPALVQVQYYGEYRGDATRPSDERAMRLDEREARIRDRIERGLNDGRLTWHEARRLREQLAQIEAKERSYESDGRMRRWEFDALQNDLDHLAQNLRYQLRDDDRRY